MNAAKRIRQLLAMSSEPEQTSVLLQLATDLQVGGTFDIRRLFQLEPEFFDLGIALLRDWRFGHHIASRSKLFEDILAQDARLQQRLCHLSGGMAH
ncbi:hypothetical protein [Chromobacterium sp. IIBBL 290-4]|uniref:hypothetical protein n=1 Tax=Chromobacterium sp. IIBBL 290-4 TaxID=2953890 RepID=UPI0020B76037|nr:hypothetical protein [Chromobacterium sp. IIBBL 290-4]UTH72956.1 hypothetical protein NKT35_15615 [Chromobacterium sp. IIBBL 290-4]